MPVALLMYALPALLLGAVMVISPAAADTRGPWERMFGMLPYLGGILGLWTVWQYALNLSGGRRFRLDWWFAVAVAGGGLASWELISTKNVVTSLLLCLPTWLLVGHLLYLRGGTEYGLHPVA
jgi:hypothetical protein